MEFVQNGALIGLRGCAQASAVTATSTSRPGIISRAVTQARVDASPCVTHSSMGACAVSGIWPDGYTMPLAITTWLMRAFVLNHLIGSVIVTSLSDRLRRRESG